MALPAATAAGAQTPKAAPGFLVVHNASTDGDPFTGKPVATVVVSGFVVGHIAQQGRVLLYHFTSSAGSLVAQAAGADVLKSDAPPCCGGQSGTEFKGSDFRFRAVGGVWRVVVYGAGVSLYAGGVGHASLHGSVYAPRSDGHYSFNGAPFRSLPAGVAKGTLGKK